MKNSDLVKSVKCLQFVNCSIVQSQIISIHTHFLLSYRAWLCFFWEDHIYNLWGIQGVL